MDPHLGTNGNPKPADQWVKLNVGGTLFLTTKLTLTRDPESFLCRICDEDFGLKSNKDENGAYLIDRDPKYFRTILNYLRHGKLIVDPDSAIQGVLEEAEFYNLAELIGMIETITKTQRTEYAVVRFPAPRIRNRLRDIETGWKLEQLVFEKDSEDEFGEKTDRYLLVTSRTI